LTHIYQELERTFIIAEPVRENEQLKFVIG